MHMHKWTLQHPAKDCMYQYQVDIGTLGAFPTFSFSDTAAAVAIELLPLPNHMPVDPSSTELSSCRLD